MKKLLALAIGIASLALFAGKAYSATSASVDVCISIGQLSVASTSPAFIVIKGTSGAIVNSAPNTHAGFRNDGDITEDFALMSQQVYTSTGGWSQTITAGGNMTATTYRVSAIFAKVSSAPHTNDYAANDILTNTFTPCSVTNFHQDSYNDPNDNNNAAIAVPRAINDDPAIILAYGPWNFVGYRDLFFKVEFPTDAVSGHGATLRVTVQVSPTAF